MFERAFGLEVAFEIEPRETYEPAFDQEQSVDDTLGAPAGR
jgi:hypothetical protein